MRPLSMASRIGWLKKGERGAQGPPDCLGYRRFHILAAYLPFLVLFILIPASLYLPHRGFFDWKVLLPYAVLSAASFAFVTATLP